MNDISITWFIIVGLVCIIIGGAGGAAFLRGMAKKAGIDIPINKNSDEISAYAASAKTAAHAAEAASEIAKTFRDTVGGQLKDLNDAIKGQGLKIDSMTTSQTRLAVTFEQFPRTCEEKHKRVDENIDRIQKELERRKSA